MKAAFLERAGVLHEPYDGYVALEDVKFYPEAGRNLMTLTLKGYLIAIVHNGKRDNGRPVSQMLSKKLEAKITRLALVRMVFASCFDLDDKSPRRMPGTGMIEEIATKHQLDLAASLFVAGSVEGAAAAESAGIGTVILLKTGVQSWTKPKGSSIRRYKSLDTAMRWITANA